MKLLNRLHIGIAVLLWVSILLSTTIGAVPRYLVEDSSNVIKSYTEDDDLAAPPGHTAVAASVIEAAYTGTIYQGGTWDGTTYTPPDGIVTPLDTDTDLGALKQAAHDMLDTFEAGIGLIESNSTIWVQGGADSALDGIHYMAINAARVALNSTRTIANRQKFLEEAGSWPTDANGDVVAYVDLFGEGACTDS